MSTKKKKVRELHMLDDNMIELDDADSKKWEGAKKKDAARHDYDDAFADPDVFIVVTDQADGKSWKVAPASCGLHCRCAAVGFPLRRVELGVLT